MIKDKLYSWYIKNVLIPQREQFDKPGFIVTRYTESNKDVFLREIALPEAIFIAVEEQATTEQEQQLYSISKSFGYRYGQESAFPTVEDGPEQVAEFIEPLARYMDIVYASSLEFEADIDQQALEMTAEDYIVCRKTGGGYIFAQGATAGLWSHAMQNTEIEAAKPACQGRGDAECRVICEPRTQLTRRDLTVSYEADINEPAQSTRDYEQRNDIRGTDYAENSLRDFLDTGFFEYTDGTILQSGERYILTEASLVYLLTRIENADLLLFDAAFEYGKKLAEQESHRNIERFLTEYLSACGWGDTLIKEKGGKYTVQAHLFPWTKFYEETSFPIYRGLVSGLLSGFDDREVRLTEVEKDTKGDGFTVIVSEG